MQSASLVGKHKWDITSYYALSLRKYRMEEFNSPFIISQPKGKHQINQYWSGRFDYGISERLDIRIGTDMELQNDYESINSYNRYHLIIGPKFSLIKSKIAFYAPIAIAIQKNNRVKTYFKPVLIFSQSVNHFIEINTSFSWIMDNYWTDGFYTANLCPTFTINDQFKIRAETGFHYDPNSKNNKIGYGLGCTWLVSK